MILAAVILHFIIARASPSLHPHPSWPSNYSLQSLPHFSCHTHLPSNLLHAYFQPRVYLSSISGPFPLLLLCSMIQCSPHSPTSLSLPSCLLCMYLIHFPHIQCANAGKKIEIWQGDVFECSRSISEHGPLVNTGQHMHCADCATDAYICVPFQFDL